MSSDWTTPGAFEVSPGVHRIPLPMPNEGLRAVNVYALTDPGEPDAGCVLIDSGWAIEESRVALESALLTIGQDLGTVRRFLVTHSHRDHYTLGIAVRRTLGTKVAIGLDEEPNITGSINSGSSSQAALVLPEWGAAALAEEWLRAYPPAAREAQAAAFEPPDEWIKPDATIAVGTRDLIAIPTPGHTRGHLVFLDRAAGVLFSGDHVLPNITPSIGFEAARPPDPLGDFLRSLELLLKYPDVRMLPAHGGPADSVHGRIAELIAHHEARLDRTQEAVLAGAGTPFEVARQLGWTRHNRIFDDLDVFNRVLATGETAAHLVVLAERGRIRRNIDGAGVQTYEPVG
ncbi:MAG TPA: MBL fold metallo-hydrolase [Sporichthyaceae bacterium]|jgi:glyoxylase-like metal-dependent hydrolase (beta-lactamase superfamily II)|nr:MBL fold metallo-hydrolase [Sporichthyaceae bacterium]